MREKTISRRLRGLAAALAFGATLISPAHANTPTVGFVQEVYIHDCCGRGPYVAVVLDRPLNGQPPCSANATILATSPTAPLAPYLIATALSAKSKGRQVTLHAKGSCDSTGVFDEWIGIELQ
jgi:hypothetical protein